MNEDTMNFIRTTDKETADKLKKLGFTILSENDSVYTFLNCGGLIYANNISDEKIIYSNTYFG